MSIMNAPDFSVQNHINASSSRLAMSWFDSFSGMHPKPVAEKDTDASSAATERLEATLRGKGDQEKEQVRQQTHEVMQRLVSLMQPPARSNATEPLYPIVAEDEASPSVAYIGLKEEACASPLAASDTDKVANDEGPDPSASDNVQEQLQSVLASTVELQEEKEPTVDETQQAEEPPSQSGSALVEDMPPIQCTIAALLDKLDLIFGEDKNTQGDVQNEEVTEMQALLSYPNKPVEPSSTMLLGSLSDIEAEEDIFVGSLLDPEATEDYLAHVDQAVSDPIKTSEVQTSVAVSDSSVQAITAPDYNENETVVVGLEEQVLEGQAILIYSERDVHAQVVAAPDETAVEETDTYQHPDKEIPVAVVQYEPVPETPPTPVCKETEVETAADEPTQEETEISPATQEDPPLGSPDSPTEALADVSDQGPLEEIPAALDAPTLEVPTTSVYEENEVRTSIAVDEPTLEINPAAKEDPPMESYVYQQALVQQQEPPDEAPAVSVDDYPPVAPTINWPLETEPGQGASSSITNADVQPAAVAPGPEQEEDISARLELQEALRARMMEEGEVQSDTEAIKALKPATPAKPMTASSGLSRLLTQITSAIESLPS